MAVIGFDVKSDGSEMRSYGMRGRSCEKRSYGEAQQSSARISEGEAWRWAGVNGRGRAKAGTAAALQRLAVRSKGNEETCHDKRRLCMETMGAAMALNGKGRRSKGNEKRSGGIA